MLKIDFTHEMVFSFDGPNLCFLGTPNDFEKLAKSIVDLTTPENNKNLDVTKLDFIQLAGDSVNIIFSSKQESSTFGKLTDGRSILFELDSRYWERIFKFFVFLAWDKRTYYLNSFEDALRDLPLEQDIHFICSSEF